MDSSNTAASRPDVLPRLSAGEPGADQECVDRYGPLVWALARKYKSNVFEAEDAVQEVFLTLWKNASRFDPSKSPESAFVNMVARRRLIDLFVRKKKQPTTVEAESQLENLPARHSLEAETRAELLLASRALAALKPEEREALLMSAYLGMSHSEIARRTDKPLGTVKTYLHRGLRRVREAVADLGPAPDSSADEPDGGGPA